MKQLIIPFLLLPFTIASCVKDKTYTYVEYTKERNLLSDGFITKREAPEEFTATADSIAYLKAYEKLCVSIRAVKNLKDEKIEILFIPVGFKLYDGNDKEITDIVFKGKDEKKRDIERKFFSEDDKWDKIKKLPIDSSDL